MMEEHYKKFRASADHAPQYRGNVENIFLVWVGSNPWYKPYIQSKYINNLYEQSNSLRAFQALIPLATVTTIQFIFKTILNVTVAITAIS